MKPLRDPVSPVYRVLRTIGAWLLRTYYPDLVVEGADRIPDGPVILAANHPNSLVDPIILSVALPRRVHWLAKATLFEGRLGRFVLRGLGAIPVHRRHEGGTRDTTQDLLRTAADTLLEGKAIGIFPEGMTHDEMRLKALKTGASRIAVLAARDLVASGATRRVNVSPVVLYFPSKTRFRSGALVLVGDPIEVHPQNEAEDVAETLRRRLEEMLVHVEDAEQERLLAAVRVLVQGRHAVGGSAADPRESHRVDRGIATALRRFAREEPERVAEFGQRLYAYCERLERHGFSLHALEPVELELHRTVLAVASLPIAIFGLAHSFIPFKLAQWASKRLSRPSDRTSVSTFGVGSGIVAFPVCWLPWAWYFFTGWGGVGAAIFLLTAPFTALIARWSLHVLRHDIGRVGDRLLTAMRPSTVRDLRQERTWLWGEIERWRTLHFGELAGKLPEEGDAT